MIMLYGGMTEDILSDLLYDDTAFLHQKIQTLVLQNKCMNNSYHL
jgi:hypothetical protein